jgi:hypothetical protein
MARYKILASGEERMQERLGEIFPDTAFDWRDPLPEALVSFLGLELIVPPAPPVLTEAQLLDAAKKLKNTEINNSRLAANLTSFTFANKVIARDDLSRDDISSTNGYVAVHGELPPGWPGAWKAVDNTYVLIPDVATWNLFYATMFAQGAANFAKSEGLKAALAAATTLEEVAAISWNPPEE